MWGPGVQGNSALSAQFCCEPTPALKFKNKAYFLKVIRFHDSPNAGLTFNSIFTVVAASKLL